jgi:hypothetical protein
VGLARSIEQWFKAASPFRQYRWFTHRLRRLERNTTRTQLVLRHLAAALKHQFYQAEMRDNPRYRDPAHLARCEHQVHSQNGEDGILLEIFRRLGGGARQFVEIGVADGLENNSAFLLIQGWRGLWIEKDAAAVRSIQDKFGWLIQGGALRLIPGAASAENVEALLTRGGIAPEFDLLSIDIDGNDYWLWRAIQNFSPRVVVIEYNSVFPPPVLWVMAHNPDASWRGTFYQGASLKSLELLGRQKGYSLVGCDFHGVNAFFVRRDLAQGKFLEPFDAETHYEPPRYLLNARLSHPVDFGRFEAV